MNYEIATLVILFSSSIGLGSVVFRKLPALSALPEPLVSQKEGLAFRLKRIIKRLNPLKGFSYELFLQKILTKIRILSLKTESKTFTWLQKLRESAQKKKIRENDNYWEEIKKATTKKK